jgi:excinuclease ABC subunit B
MRNAIEETTRRRAIQDSHNRQHGIVPASIVKEVKDITDRVRASTELQPSAVSGTDLSEYDLTRLIKDMEKQMRTAGDLLEFEKAGMLRDQIIDLRKILVDEHNA